MCHLVNVLSIIIQGKSLNGSFTEKTLLIQQSIDCNHENTINTFFRCSIIKPITVSNGKGESVVFEKGYYTLPHIITILSQIQHTSFSISNTDTSYGCIHIDSNCSMWMKNKRLWLIETEQITIWTILTSWYWHWRIDMNDEL